MWMFNPPSPTRGSPMRQELDGAPYAGCDQVALPPWLRIVSAPDPRLRQDELAITRGTHYLERFLYNGRLVESTREYFDRVGPLHYGTRQGALGVTFWALIQGDLEWPDGRPRPSLYNDVTFNTGVIHDDPSWQFGTDGSLRYTGPNFSDHALRTILLNAEECEEAFYGVNRKQAFTDVIEVDLWAHPDFGGRNLRWVGWKRDANLGTFRHDASYRLEQTITIGDQVFRFDFPPVRQDRQWEVNWVDSFAVRFGAYLKYLPTGRFDIRYPTLLEGQILVQTSDARVMPMGSAGTVTMEPWYL